MKRNIKKTAVAFFAAAAVFAMGSVSTFAAEPGCGRYYEDADQTGKSRQKTWMPFLNNREKAG